MSEGALTSSQASRLDRAVRSRAVTVRCSSVPKPPPSRNGGSAKIGAAARRTGRIDEGPDDPRAAARAEERVPRRAGRRAAWRRRALGAGRLG